MSVTDPSPAPRPPATDNPTSSHGPPASRVTLARTDERDGKQRQVLITIDGGPTTTLMYGDQHEVAIEPGPHVLKANNTLVWKRVPFEVGAGEHVEFQLINRPGRLTLSFLALLGVAPLYLEVERRTKAS